MAGFVLIHGSWHGGWCFDAVAQRLRALGHMVDAPDLPGMGGSEAELRAATLAGWGEFAAARCQALRDAGCDRVILAGHSRGGMIVSEAAERHPDAMDGIAYICAIMLPSGMSRVEFKRLQEPTPDFDALVTVLPHGQGSVVDVERAPAVFAQLAPPDIARDAARRTVAEPLGVRATPVTVSAERWGALPRTYIECTQDRTIPLSSQRLMQKLCPGARVIALHSDHSPFLSCPDELSEALLSCL